MSKLSSKNFLLIAILIILTLGLFIGPSLLCSKEISNAYVYYNNYEITSYHVEIEVNNENVYKITENIVVKFGDPIDGLHKGIGRAIPYVVEIEQKHKDKTFRHEYRAKVSDVGANKLYDYYTQDGIMYIELGDDDYVNMEESTEQIYTLSYTFDVGDDFNREYDFSNLNIIGTDFPVDVNNVTFSITYPKDFDNTPNFTIGKFGSENQTQLNLTKTLLEDGRVNMSYNEGINLKAYEGLTLKHYFEEGYFDGLKEVVDSRNTSQLILLIVAIVLTLIIVVVSIVFNAKKHKVVATVEFYPPDDTTPVDAGYLLNGNVSNKDMMSLIVYWASKNMVKINLTEEKTPESVTKLQNIPEHAPEYEKIMFESMFSYSDTFELDTQNNNFASSITYAIKEVPSNNRDRISKRSRLVKSLLNSISIIFLIAVLFVELSWHRWFVLSNILGFNFISALLIFSGLVLIDYGSKKHSKKWWYFVFGGLFLAGAAVLLITMRTYFTLPLYIKLLSLLPIITVFALNGILREFGDKQREKISKLKGFKNNLIMVEEKKLKMLVDEDPEYFYNILPYAYTLDIADDFIKKFENISMPVNDNFGDIVTLAYLLSFSRSMRSVSTSRSFTSGSGGFGAGGGFGGGGAFGR